MDFDESTIDQTKQVTMSFVCEACKTNVMPILTFGRWKQPSKEKDDE